MKTMTATAPSHWASYLINGDSSGMEQGSIDQAKAWIAREEMGWPVSCEDAGFLTFHDARHECPLSADCQEYVFLIEEN